MNNAIDSSNERPVNEDEERFAAAWSDHHGFLLDVAYRLLGSYGDAEDVVQEAFSRLLRVDLDPIEDLRAWLVVVVSRLCLDQLRSARMRRESSVGPWFPEPLIGLGEATADPSDLVTLDESVRMAFLIVLERMSPAERVVFVLHDLFAYPFEEVAAIVGRSPAACRQVASRARRWIREEAGASRFQIDREEHRRVIEAFIAACSTGDVDALLSLLDPSVMGWADAGRVLPSVRRPTIGSQNVAEAAMRFFRPGSGKALIPRAVNGEPGIIAMRKNEVFAVVVFTVKNGLITRMYAQADPRKLAYVQQVLEQERLGPDPQSGV
jgi:RNA polymerase sigma-70 factor (ECF subfamily)